MSTSGSGYQDGGDGRRERDQDERWRPSQKVYESCVRKVTPKEAEDLIRLHGSCSEPLGKPKYTPGPCVRPSGVLGEDGKMYMVPFESKLGNEDRNIPLSLPKKYDVGKEIRKQLLIDKFTMEEIRASFYARTCFELDDERPLPFNRTFLIVHFGVYCVNFQGAHPGEFAIVAFSVKDGISQSYGRMIDPGEIPFGFRSDFYSACEEKGYEHPGFDPNFDFAKDCLDIIENFMEKCTTEDARCGTLYTSRAQVDLVKDALKFVAKKAGREFRFKVFPMSRLLELLLVEGEQLRCLNKIEATSQIFTEEDAIALMVDGKWNDHKELNCKFHGHYTKQEFMDHCCMRLVKQWIYNSLELLTRVYCCPMYIYTHIPKLGDSFNFVVESPPLSRSSSVIAIEGDAWLPGFAKMRVSSESHPPTRDWIPASDYLSSPTAESEPSSPIRAGTASSPRIVSAFGRGRGHGGWHTSSHETPPQSTYSITSHMITSDGDDSVHKLPGFMSSVEEHSQHEALSGQDAGSIVNMPIDYDAEYPIYQSYVTSELYPNLSKDYIADERGMKVSWIPDLCQRQFPKLEEGIELVVTVKGPKSAAKPEDLAPLQPLTVFRFTTTEHLPVSCDFSFATNEILLEAEQAQPEGDRRATEEQREDRQSRPESVMSYDSMMTGVSTGFRRLQDPLLREGLKQANHLLRNPVLPTTQFVYTGKQFWDNDDGHPGRSNQEGLLPPVSGIGRGRGRGRRQPQVVLPSPEIVPGHQGSPWLCGGVSAPGRGRGRGGQYRPPWVPGLENFAPPSSGPHSVRDDDEEDGESINSSLDHGRDIDYYDR